MITLALYIWMIGKGEMDYNGDLAFGLAIFDLFAISMITDITLVNIEK